MKLRDQRHATRDGAQNGLAEPLDRDAARTYHLVALTVRPWWRV